MGETGGRSGRTCWLLPTLLLLLASGGCSRSTGLLVNVLTDLQAPGQLDEVSIRVQSPGYQYDNQGNPWQLGPGTQDRLPGSFAVYSEKGPVEVTVLVTGLLGRLPIVERTAILRMEPGKVLYLSVALTRSCVLVSAGGTLERPCSGGDTCIEGTCQSPTIGTGVLPEYSEEREAQVECDSSPFVDTRSNDRLETGGECGQGERCREGTCLPVEVPSQDGGPEDGGPGGDLADLPLDGEGPSDGGDGPDGDVGPDGGDRPDLPPSPRTYEALELLAGQPGGCGSLDDTGDRARFQNPTGVVADGAGGAYVADAGNCVIRHVTSAGVTTLVAGNPRFCGANEGPLAEARFSSSLGAMVRDVAGLLYVADAGLGRIRRINLATGMVDSIPITDEDTGSPLALGAPVGLAFDQSENLLYVSEADRHTILAVSMSTFTARTIAGLPGRPGYADGLPSAAQFDRPYGLLVRSGEVLVADSGNNAIRSISLTDQQTTTLIGQGPSSFGSENGPSGTARFPEPQSIAELSPMELLVTDSLNHTIRLLDVTAPGSPIASTWSGSAGQPGSTDGSLALARFGNPVGLSIAGGEVFVTEFGNCTLRRATVADGVTTLAGKAPSRAGEDGTGTEAAFRGPGAIVALPSGDDLVVAESFEYKLRPVTSSSREVSTLTLDPRITRGVWGGLAASATNELYVSDVTNHWIVRYRLDTFEELVIAGTGMRGSSDGPGAVAEFNVPIAVALDQTGSLYVADRGSGVIRRINVTGTSSPVTTVAGEADDLRTVDGPVATARFKSLEGIALDVRGGSGPLGALLISDGPTVRRLDLDAGMVETLAGTPGSPGFANGIGSAARFIRPRGLAVEPSGRRVIVADLGALRFVDLATRAVTTPVGEGPGRRGYREGPLPALINEPADLAFLPDGDLLITDMAENVVYRLR